MLERSKGHQLAVIGLTAGAALILIHTLGSLDTYVRLFPPPPSSDAPEAHYWRLYGMVWWTAVRLIAYAALPCLILRTALRRHSPIASFHGCRWPALIRSLPLTAALYLAALPAVWWAAHQPGFQATYPLYRLAQRSAFDFVAWEALYLAQFAALEFFFRGFLVAGLAKSTGARAAGALLPRRDPLCVDPPSKAAR